MSIKKINNSYFINILYVYMILYIPIHILHIYLPIFDYSIHFYCKFENNKNIHNIYNVL